MTAPLAGLPYYGGKSFLSPKGVGKWVLSLLPPVAPGQTYVEPFAGMLGVLLARPPAACEVVNDLDRNVANWWRCLRDTPDELERLLAATEHGRQVFVEAQQVLDAPDAHADVKRAWAFCVAVAQAIRPATTTASGAWLIGRGIKGATVSDTTTPSDTTTHKWRGIAARQTITAMRQRLSAVSVECRDGVTVAAYYASNPYAVVYCDPPYATGSEGFSHGVSQKALIAVLRDADARVAISGYPDDPYDELDWRRYERDVAAAGTASQVGRRDRRTEVLWCNYAPPQGVLL